MSVPFNTVKCSRCDFSSWLLSRSGWKYYQLPNNVKLDVRSAWGWCYDCYDFKAIENLPVQQSIINRLYEEQTDLSNVKNVGLQGRLLQLLGKDSFLIEQINDQIENSQNWLYFLNHRRSPARCLTCSSINIESLEIPKTDDYKGYLLDNFNHPDCGGNLWLRRHEMSLNVQYTPKGYNIEGQFVQETG